MISCNRTNTRNHKSLYERKRNNSAGVSQTRKYMDNTKNGNCIITAYPNGVWYIRVHLVSHPAHHSDAWYNGRALHSRIETVYIPRNIYTYTTHVPSSKSSYRIRHTARYISTITAGHCYLVLNKDIHSHTEMTGKLYSVPKP